MGIGVPKPYKVAQNTSLEIGKYLFTIFKKGQLIKKLTPSLHDLHARMQMHALRESARSC